LVMSRQTEKSNATADPSTPLRFAQDDSSFVDESILT
jgi:hypothetical protein